MLLFKAFSEVGVLSNSSRWPRALRAVLQRKQNGNLHSSARCCYNLHFSAYNYDQDVFDSLELQFQHTKMGGEQTAHQFEQVLSNACRQKTAFRMSSRNVKQLVRNGRVACFVQAAKCICHNVEQIHLTHDIGA